MEDSPTEMNSRMAKYVRMLWSKSMLFNSSRFTVSSCDVIRWFKGQAPKIHKQQLMKDAQLEEKICENAIHLSQFSVRLNNQHFSTNVKKP